MRKISRRSSIARDGRIGEWVARPDKSRAPGGEIAEDKIAAIGIRVRRWVSLHGIALNVAPDLPHFSGIVPRGIAAAHFGVTSLRDLGVHASVSEIDAALRRTFQPIFGKSVRNGSAMIYLSRRS
jgi:lipoyl(octanoyl) transferase